MALCGTQVSAKSTRVPSKPASRKPVTYREVGDDAWLIWVGKLEKQSCFPNAMAAALCSWRSEGGFEGSMFDMQSAPRTTYSWSEMRAG